MPLCGLEKIIAKFRFLLGDFPKSTEPIRGFEKTPRIARRVFGTLLRPPFVASRLIPASASTRCTAGCPREFQNLFQAQKNWVKIPQQKPEFSIIYTLCLVFLQIFTSSFFLVAKVNVFCFGFLILHLSDLSPVGNIFILSKVPFDSLIFFCSVWVTKIGFKKTIFHWPLFDPDFFFDGFMGRRNNCLLDFV